MNEIIALFLAASVGVVLGTLFFGGLWWTTTRAVTSERPALLFFGSFLVRMTIALAGFYLVGLGNWQRLLACLVGFILARLLVIWLTRPVSEAAHAS